MKIRLGITLLSLTLLSTSILFGQEDYWKAEEYFQNSSSQKNAASDLLKYVEIEKEAHILDVGCGDGKITAELALSIPEGSILGVDISPAMIEFAKNHFPDNNFPNLTFAILDAQKLNYDQQFDNIFSFTTLQWIKDHKAFLDGAYKSLKPEGTLAITMPMGLPFTLEQAVKEKISSGEWSSYFLEFDNGWNFVKDSNDYSNLAKQSGFKVKQIEVVPQKDIFPSRAVFEGFIGQWFPYLRPLPEHLKKPFLTTVVDRFLELETPFSNGEVHFKIRRLEMVATK